MQSSAVFNEAGLLLFLSFEKSITAHKIRHTTRYKNNSGIITKTKVCKYKKALCLAEK
jgi:hypothetical protein